MLILSALRDPKRRHVLMCVYNFALRERGLEIAPFDMCLCAYTYCSARERVLMCWYSFALHEEGIDSRLYIIVTCLDILECIISSRLYVILTCLDLLDYCTVFRDALLITERQLYYYQSYMAHQLQLQIIMTYLDLLGCGTMLLRDGGTEMGLL